MLRERNFLTIKENVVYGNGIAITGALQVIGFFSDEATLRAKSPFIIIAYEFWLIRTHDSYLVRSLSLSSYQNIEDFYMIK